MKHYKSFFALISTTLFLLILGCKSSGVVQLSPDTYMIYNEDKGGIFGNSAKMKASTIREANEFASRQGKIAIPIGTQSKPMQLGSFATFEYQFRVVDKNDPEARRTSLVPRANIVTENKEDIKLEINNSSKTNGDLYSELSKLDDLKNRGIITDEEFQTLKRKILNK